MKTADAKVFHKLYGPKKQRTNFQDKDFLDYTIMLSICSAIMWYTYGAFHVMTMVGIGLCGVMLIDFVIRHGVKLRMPVILSSPQEIVYSLIYKVQNLYWPFFAALALLLLENYLIFLTPNWPHKLELTHQVVIGLFWTHFAIICTYRTAILVAHLRKTDHVRAVLLESSVLKALVTTKTRTVFEIFHAYFTGLLTHIVYLTPWYLVLTYSNFSLLFVPVTCLLAYVIQQQNVHTLNAWFYRDHWVGHNSEFDFLYVHGTHHDAIPSSIIAVAGNGILEGFFRGALAFPIPFYNPLIAAFVYTVDVKIDMDLHQYIPGVFPKLNRELIGSLQHSLHHFGRIEPYGFGINLDKPMSDELKKLTSVLPDELKYSIKLDQELTDYQWDNPRFKWYLELVDKYDPPPAAPKEQEAGKIDASAAH